MKPTCVCVECGGHSKQLYRKFEGGAIQLLQCEHCKAISDKYVEYDEVILLLDALLLRVQVYRHLIFNHRISPLLMTIFAVLLLICEAYARLRTSTLHSGDSILVQIHFHTLLLQTSLELIIAVGIIHCTVVCIGIRVSVADIFKMLIISSFGKLSSVSALIWNEDFYPWISMATVLPAQTQACRAVLNVGLLSAVLLVAIQNGLVVIASYTLNRWRLGLVELWYDLFM